MSYITSPVPSENNKCDARIMEIKFDCFVKLFDFINMSNPVVPGLSTKNEAHPQRFALVEQMSLEDIKYLDEYEIGRRIKQAYKKLEQHMDEYLTEHEKCELHKFAING